MGGCMENDSQADRRKQLLHFLSSESDTLVGILRVYAVRAGLPAGEDQIAELLNSTTVEALAHAQRYDPARPARAWLLGIAANLVRRRQADLARLNRREPLAGDLAEARRPGLGEDEFFERLAGRADDLAGFDVHRQIEERDGLSSALRLLSAHEREIIRLFAQSYLDGDALAAALHVTPGAARVRLHRALTHLRRVWFFTTENEPHD